MAGKPPPSGKGAALASQELGHGPVVKPHIPTAKAPPKRVPLPPVLNPKGDTRFVKPPPAPKPRVPLPARNVPKPQPTVRQVQRQLNRAGYKIAVDGVYGPQTAAAIKAYNAEVDKQHADATRAIGNIYKTQAAEPQGEANTTADDLLPTTARHSTALTTGLPTDYEHSSLWEPHPYAPADGRRVADRPVKNIGGGDITGLVGLAQQLAAFGKHPTLTGGLESAVGLAAFVPPLRGLRGAQALVQGVREGEGLQGAVRGAIDAFHGVPDGALPRVSEKVRNDVLPSLRASQARAEIHLEIDRQIEAAGYPKAEATKLKDQVDNAAMQHAKTAGRKPADRQAAATQFYDDTLRNAQHVDPHNLGDRAPVDPQFVQDEIATHNKGPHGKDGPNMLAEDARTPAQLTNLMQELDSRLREGYQVGKGWYARGGAAIKDVSGGDVSVGGKADQVAALTAIYSPQRAVVPNIGLALQAREQFLHSQAATGAGSVEIGAPWQMQAAKDIMEGRDWRADLGPNQSLKIRSFYGNLLKHIDPELMAARGYRGNEVTADGWMAAAFHYGYNTDQSLTPKQYRFMVRATQKLADHYGIAPEDAQAAIWMSIKAERDRQTARLFQTDPQAAIAQSGADFATGLDLPVHNVRFYFEATSSKKAWQYTLDEATAIRYMRAQAQGVTAAMHDAGMIGSEHTFDASLYLNDAGMPEVNPAAAVDMPVGNRPTSSIDPKTGKPKYDKAVAQAVTPEQRALYDAVAAAIGDALEQEGAPWLRPVVSKANSDATGVEIILGRAPNSDDMRAVATYLDHANFYAAPTEHGVMVVRLNPDDHLILEGKPRAQSAAVLVAHAQDIVEKALPGGQEIQLFTHRGGYTLADGYSSAIEGSGRPDLLSRFVDSLHRNVDAVDRAFGAPPRGFDAAAADAGANDVNVPSPGRDTGAPDDVAQPAPTDDPAVQSSIDRANELTAAWQQNIQDVIAQQERDNPHAAMGDTIGRAHRGLDTPYEPRTLRSKEGAVGQAQKPRSLIAEPAARGLDHVSEWLDHQAVLGHEVRDIPGARLISASDRVAKNRGRLERIRGERAKNQPAIYRGIHDISKVKEGSLNDVAQFWYRQWPEAYRNAHGFQLLHDAQRAEFEYIASGKAGEALDGLEKGMRSQLAEAETAGEAFKIMRDLEEIPHTRADLKFRVEDISASLAVLEKLIGNAPAVDEAAIEGMAAMARDRERVLLDSVKPSERAAKAEEFANRKTLVADWLGMPSDGTEEYVGHRLPDPESAPRSNAPTVGGTGRVKGPRGMNTQNNLVLAVNGRLKASTRGAYKDWEETQVFAQAHRAREYFAEESIPFTSGSVDWKRYAVLNPKGEVYPKAWKDGELAALDTNLSERDEIREKAKDIIAGYYADDQKAFDQMMAADPHLLKSDLRLVRRRTVDRYYSQFRSFKGRGMPLKAYDAMIDVVATSIIFARVGYIPKNIVQNLIMAVPHQGAFFALNVVRAHQALADYELRHLIMGEIAHTGATASLAPATIKKGIGKVIGAVTDVADLPIRTSAFLHEAAAQGVISKWVGLMTAKDRQALIDLFTLPKHEALLNDIRSRSVEAMGDFSRMTPDQARNARRFAVIPGWLMAGTRYPFHFAATHPIRSALLAYAALGEPGMPDSLYFKNKPGWTYLHGSSYLQGIDTPWGRERTNSISPISTPWDLVNAVIGTVQGKQGPFDHRSTIFDEAAPLLKAIVLTLKGEGGKKKGIGQAAIANLESLFPNYKFVQGEIDPKSTASYPGDNTRAGRFFRELGIIPIPVGSTTGQTPATGPLRSGTLPGSGRSKMPGSGGAGSFPGSSGGGGFPG